jgi:multiple sugar transport system ATP-binding protein
MAKVSVQHVFSFLTKESSGEAFGVRDFNVEVDDRELVVLAGPKGCGKGLVLRMIAGLDPVERGEIAIAGKRIDGLAPKDRDIAMVFRGDTLYPRMTVAENLAFGLKMRKFPEAEIKRRVAETAGMLGLEGCLGQRPEGLSTEERFRAGLGRAIARQPKVFLFDEPLARLDAPARAAMRAEILRLHLQLQATFIYATADPVEAMTLAGRIVVMREGAIEQAGAPAALYREPENQFVAGWLGNPPMNFIRGKLREAGETLVFKETGDGVVELKFTGLAKDLAGREVFAGIRAEDIKIVSADAKPGGQRIRALLDIVEWTGADALAHIETGAHKLIARTAGVGGDEAGHRVQFEIDPARVLFFDPETGRRIGA